MQTQEQWKDIPRYEGLYQVSDQGNVKSLNYRGTGKENVLKLSQGNRGYLNVSLYKNNKRKLFYVHQLVAIVFLGHKPKNYEFVIDHINSNGLDNRLENLRIITSRENLSKERTSKSGLPTGVSKYGNKFRSRIRINKKHVYLGLFSTQEEASKAYQDKLKEIQQLSSNPQIKD